MPRTGSADQTSGGIGTGMNADVHPLPSPSPSSRYTDWSVDAIIADFVLVRGDLDDASAREQLAQALLVSADVADREASAFTEGRAVQAKEIADQCRNEAARPDPVTGDHTTPSYWNGHNAALRRVTDRQEFRIAEAFAPTPARAPQPRRASDRAAA